MYAGTELWGLAPLMWAVAGLIAVRLLARPRRAVAPAADVRRRDDIRRAA